MATQPNLPQAETKGAQLAPITNPMEGLKPFLNDKGEMDIANLQFGERMAAFQSFMERSNCNLPLWATNLLTQFPAGTTLLPMPVYPQKKDAWRGDDAKKMQLKPNHVEPSADFIISLGNLVGITLKKVFEGVVDVDGRKVYSVRYNAHLMLPNGAILTAEEEGKDQSMLTSSGSLQAHIAESTRKKAKRNAIKALLCIPTSMEEAEFDRPWVMLRPVFHEGVSGGTDRIIAEQRRISDHAKQMLFGPGPSNSGAQVIDVTPRELGEVAPADIVARIQAAQSVQELDEIVKASADVPKTEAQRKEITQAYKDRKSFIDGAIAQEGGGF